MKKKRMLDIKLLTKLLITILGEQVSRVSFALNLHVHLGLFLYF